MNLLIDGLPECVELDGSPYPLRTDFRIWVMFELLMQDPLLTEDERVMAALNLCYETIPNDMEGAITGLLCFYSCGKPPKQRESGDAGGARAIYSFEQDDDYIYAAFMDQYGIDIQEADMHWWKFKALFKGLKEGNLIVKIMGYRAMTIDSKMSEEQKRFYYEMKELYALDDNRSEEEKQKDFEQDLLGGL